MSLEFKRYSFGYTKPLILASDIKIKKGEVLPLIGLNGTGKTSFFKSILNLLPLKEGSISWQGKELKPNDIKEVFSFLFQEENFLSSWRVGDYLEMGGGNLQSNSSRDLFDVIKWSDLYFHELSDGMKARVYLSKALSRKRSAFFLDEPLAFIDEFSKREILKNLSALGMKDEIIVFSTHDWTICSDYFDEALVLSKGEEIKKVKLDEFKASFQHPPK